MITLTVTHTEVVRKHKFFHFEYLVLMELLDVRYGYFTLIERKLIARDLCLFGVIEYGELEFKLEHV